MSFDLNPKFVFLSPVHSTDLDVRQLTEHVDHAIIALDGRAPVGGDVTIEEIQPALSVDTLRVDLWVNELADFTCSYGFLISSKDARVPYARGERVVVNLDPASQRPSKWSHDFRVAHEELLKDLPAYA